MGGLVLTACEQNWQPFTWNNKQEYETALWCTQGTCQRPFFNETQQQFFFSILYSFNVCNNNNYKEEASWPTERLGKHCGDSPPTTDCSHGSYWQHYIGSNKFTVLLILCGQPIRRYNQRRVSRPLSDINPSPLARTGGQAQSSINVFRRMGETKTSIVVFPRSPYLPWR